MSQRLRFVPVFLAVCIAVACGKPSNSPAASGQGSTAGSKEAAAKKPHVFRGKVEKVDPATKTLTVNGEDVEGWMPAMTMVYEVDKPDVLTQVAVGDQISATVYDGDFRTLHDVKRSADKPK
jgi:Cu/Ag efflux protein CusF